MNETNYWIISPKFSIDKDFDSVWEYDLKNGTIAIGWNDIGELNKLSRDEALKLYDEKYPDDNMNRRSRDFNTLWRFYNEINVGDIIIARKGTKKVLALGYVTSTAFRNDELAQERDPFTANYPFPHFLKIHWFMLDAIEYEEPQFSPYVFRKTDNEKIMSLGLHKFIKDFEYADIPEEELPSPDREFALEAILRDFLYNNFDVVFEGNLELYEDPKGKSAKEFKTDVGRIDILAIEPESNALVVIELKRSSENDKVIGQTQRYMGWVNEHLTSPEQQVRGLIILKAMNDKLRYALCVTQNIEVKEYRMQFRLVDP